MNLIDRYFLNGNLKIHKNNTVYDYVEIVKQINQAKTYLIKERNAQPGDKIFFASTLWPHYLAWFIAASELGLGFVVSDFPLLNRSKSVNKKLSLYGDIKHVIKGAAPGLEEFFNADHNDFWKDKVFDHKAYVNSSEEFADVFWATPDNVLIYATSSGTTGTPTVDAYTQEFFYKLAIRNAGIYDLKHTDRCLHTRNLHHGSVCGVYFLPTLRYCENHFPFEDPGNKGWVDLIQEKQLNRALFFYDMADIFAEHADIDTINNLRANYFVLAPVKENFLKFFEDKSKIYSVFGSGETCGPLFLPQVTKKMIAQSNFGKPLDDFYKISIQDGLISVIMPDGRTTTSGDRFDLIDGNYIHKGRKNLYRINGIALYVDILVSSVEEITNLKNTKEIDIVLDEEYDSIYIRSDVTLDLNKINAQLVKITGLSHYCIAKQINKPRTDFFNGIKFDPFDVRLACRELQ